MCISIRANGVNVLLAMCLSSFSGEMCIQILCPLLSGLICPFIVELCILNTSPLLDKLFAYIFSHSVSYLFPILDGILGSTKVFNFDKVQLIYFFFFFLLVLFMSY